MNQKNMNPLATGPIGGLMVKFAVPSIIAMLVGALYNIVDQFFIGQTVGTLGNAATNIAFPLSTLCTATALMFGIGGASCFNLDMGRKKVDEAPYYIGNSVTMVLTLGLLLTVITQIFLKPLLLAFGSPDDVLPYAMQYVRITSIGFPFLILTSAGGHLIRADGSPNMSMICNLSGAIINTFLDYLFTMVLSWGITGAALATIMGQIFSAGLVINYMRRFKTVPLVMKHFKIHLQYVKKVSSIGIASFINMVSMMVVQIVSNRSLKYYGALSIYGPSVPIAVAGIVGKVSQLFFSVVIGISQGSQPIESFNYGAKNYDRVKKTYYLAILAGGAMSMISFLVFQFAPRSIIAFFGQGSDLYFEFGIKYFRIFFFFIWINCLQPITTTLFTSIGKPKKGIFLSLTRQIIFFLPLIMILPRFLGIDGILYAGPIADGTAAIVTIVMAYYELKEMNRLKMQQN